MTSASAKVSFHLLMFFFFYVSAKIELNSQLVENRSCSCTHNSIEFSCCIMKKSVMKYTLISFHP